MTRFVSGLKVKEDKEAIIFYESKKHEKKFVEKNGRKTNSQIMYIDEVRAVRVKEFTGCCALFSRYLTFVPKLLASQSDHVAYFFMILSMMINAGLISLPFPFLVFGYALIKENGPGKVFWKIVLWYTCFVIIFKAVA